MGGGGFRPVGNRGLKPGWWKNVLGLSLGEGGRWIRDNLYIKLGDGEKISFWHHAWVGESSLKVLFPRLFRLCSNQGGSVKEMGGWVEGVWVWNLEWRRDLFDREKEQVNNLMNIINGVVLSAGLSDAWWWKPSAQGLYSVKSAYSIMSVSSTSTNGQEDYKLWTSIWRAPAPFKAITTAWRVVKGRMATCDNLVKRKVEISSDEAKCVACKNHPETTNHIFFSCTETAKIWQNVIRWLGKQSTFHHEAKVHLMSFINLGKKVDKRFLIGVWIVIVWCIWKWRNECKFNKSVWDRGKIFSEIKSRMWSWKLSFSIPIQVDDFRLWFSSENLLADP